MASTISNINTALVDERVIGALRYALPTAELFSFGITQEEKLQNDIVRVPIGVDPDIATKTAGTLLTATGSLTGNNVTLSNFRGAAWDATEGAVSAMTIEKYWADKAAGAAYVTVKDAIDAALALLTAANFGSGENDQQITAPADFNQLALAGLWTKGETKIKRQDKVVMLNAIYSGQVLGNSNLALVRAMSGQQDTKSGIITDFAGMKVLVYPAFPTTGNLSGAVVGKAALLLGTARPSMLMESGEGNIVDRRVITDPNSGLSVMYTMKADAGGTITGEVCMLYGVAKGQDAAVRLLSASPS